MNHLRCNNQLKCKSSPQPVYRRLYWVIKLLLAVVFLSGVPVTLRFKRSSRYSCWFTLQDMCTEGVNWFNRVCPPSEGRSTCLWCSLPLKARFRATWGKISKVNLMSNASQEKKCFTATNFSFPAKLWISSAGNVLSLCELCECLSSAVVKALRSVVWAAAWLDTRRSGGLTYSWPLSSWWTEPETQNRTRHTVTINSSAFLFSCSPCVFN